MSVVLAFALVYDHDNDDGDGDDDDDNDGEWWKRIFVIGDSNSFSL